MMDLELTKLSSTTDQELFDYIVNENKVKLTFHGVFVTEPFLTTTSYSTMMMGLKGLRGAFMDMLVGTDMFKDDEDHVENPLSLAKFWYNMNSKVLWGTMKGRVFVLQNTLSKKRKKESIIGSPPWSKSKWWRETVEVNKCFEYDQKIFKTVPLKMPNLSDDLELTWYFLKDAKAIGIR